MMPRRPRSPSLALTSSSCAAAPAAPWRRLCVLATLLTVVTAGACSPRALVEVDVIGDAPFQSVTLQLAVGSASKSFAGASFTADTPFKAGVFVGDGSATVAITARALDSSGTCIGIGVGAAMDVSGGNATAPVKITVAHTSSCASALPGTGGSSGNGTGGASGGDGGQTGTGTGGAGTGVGGSNGGGGGATGTGGQTGGGTNLVTNGDFSNGETGWGIPSMMGSVSHAVTNGAFCVTLSSAAASVTVGYPAGATAPLQITGGTSYRFSYQASVSASNTTFEAKVGQTQMPYDATGSDWPTEPVSATLQPFTHTFMRSASDSSMGVAFNLMGGPSTVCIDNVSLAPN
jgi:hypothetical protein